MNTNQFYSYMPPCYPMDFGQMQMQPQMQFPQQMEQQMVPMQPSGSVIPGVPFPGGAQQGPGVSVTPSGFVEESYIENILRANLGKTATIYQTFENNREWNAKVFQGVLEAAGRDHIIISDPQTGRRYLLQMVNLDYITFDEPLTYVRPSLPPGVR